MGIEAIGGEGTAAGTATLAAAFKASGATLACLCGADKTSEQEAAAAAAVLNDAGAPYIYLAGRPGQSEAAYRAAGIETFIYAGCDAVAMLEAAHSHIGRIAS